MIFKYKIPAVLSNEAINRIAEEQKMKILGERGDLKYIGSSCSLEAEDILRNIKTLLLAFDDPD